MQGKPVALVTGANQGIGLQIVGELAACGLLCWLGSHLSSRAVVTCLDYFSQS